jgi:serine/threonine protein kinase
VADRNEATADDDRLLPGTTPLTIQLPLGCTASASVFLVRAKTSDLRLLRLKRWHRPAPLGFVAGFEQFVTQVADWNHEDVVVPFAAGIDAAGRAWVLSDFRQGLPILESVKTGRLQPDSAAAVLVRLLGITRTAHARGLAHGSIVPGNVIVHPDSGAAYLLDFGLAPLLADSMDRAGFVSSDLAGFAALERALPAAHRGPSRREL